MGQKRLEKALSTFAKDKQIQNRECPTSAVEVTWKPFMIDPNTSIDGEEFEAYNIRRWGGSSWTHQLKRVGKKDGATFQNWKWWPNTLKAHQLIHYAKMTCGLDTSTSNAVIFRALYEEGENVSLLDTLVRIGIEKLGLPDENNLRRYLEEDEGEEDVLEDIRQCRRMYQVQSVPTFIVEKQGTTACAPIVLSGAQSSAAFLQAFYQMVD